MAHGSEELRRVLERNQRKMTLLLQGKIRPRRARFETDGNHFTLELNPGYEYIDGTPYDEDEAGPDPTEGQ